MQQTLCILCSQPRQPFQPDNRTIVPVCERCWGRLGGAEAIRVLQGARLIESLEGIAAVLGEWAEGRAADQVEERLRRRRSSEGN